MAFPPAKLILSFIVLLRVITSRADIVTVNITDTRLVWSGPNRYHTKCGGVKFLTKNEHVLLNFTGEREPIVFVRCPVSSLPSDDSRYRHYDQLRGV